MGWTPWRRKSPGSEVLAQAINELSRANTVAFGGVGITGAKPPAVQAFSLVLAAGYDARADVERLLYHASPAGRVYAAVLLGALDRGAGRAAWQYLTTQHGTVAKASGCVISSADLSEVAAAELECPSLSRMY